MTQAKVKELKMAYNKEFGMIFQLCDYVLQATTVESLVSMTLQTLLRFLNWISVEYIFETSLIETIVVKYFSYPQFRLDALKCLVEIGSLDIRDLYQPKFVMLYKCFLDKLKTLHIPPSTNMKEMWERGDDTTQDFILTVSMFLTGFFRPRLALLEQDAPTELLEGIHYLVQISRVGDWEVLKICVDFWHFFASDMYYSEVNRAPSAPLMLSLGSSHTRSPRWLLYSRILSDVRRVIIENMAKPEEVLIVEDENGEIVREAIKDSDMITVYKTMREELVFLTHLDYDDTENIMIEKLCQQMDGSEWSWNNLNTLCWAIGSISGAFNKDKEKNFLVTVIKDLLSLCEMKRGKDNKAVIASNIMYVVGQYPRFLQEHWKFLKTVVNKLFEFMHETHPGVQDMACDTFLKIAEKCRREFVVQQPHEDQPFVEELLVDNPSINPLVTPAIPPFTLRQVIARLERHQIHTVYEAVGTMISSLSDTDMARKELLVAKLMAIPNNEWSDIINQAAIRADSVCDPETVHRVINVLKTNTRACYALGHNFKQQLRVMHDSMLHVYTLYSKVISDAISNSGVVAAQHSNIRSMRTAKREIMRLIETFVDKGNDPTFVSTQLASTFMKPVLEDYNQCVAEARNPEVLLLFATIINKTKDSLLAEIPIIFAAVFEVTLQMITDNFESFPEHRTYFFQLIHAVTKHCFPAFFQMSEAHFKLVIDSIIWAFKHHDRVNSELGLTILEDFLNRMEQNVQVATMCYQRFFVLIMQEVFSVLTDTFHKSGFKQQATILMHMFSIVESNQLASPVFDVAQHPQFQSNKLFLLHYITNLIVTSFPNLNRVQVERFAEGLFTLSSDANMFKNHLRDFLVQLKEFSSQDNNELFIDEAAVQLQQQQKRAVPGLVAGDDGMAD
eukprot:c12235_g1_i3.p1 GENE.c12235_g1_i3~~c12235_g1_i3.p1  ORF type:complete len:901 (-),score=304.83 c12235_g1_i3:85-2787(-)